MTATEDNRTLSLNLLRDLGACPAVAFQEAAVAANIQRFVSGLGLTIESDRYGNLLVHLPGRRDVQGQQPPIAFVAHMDHPGFEAIEARGTTVIARALGGVPRACFTERVPVQMILPNNERLAAETEGSYGVEEQKLVSLHLNEVNEARAMEFPMPVVLDLPDYHFDGELIHMRALDDLAGCAAILAALELLASQEPEVDVYAVFTRAEEVGLIGARLIAEARRLPVDTLVVSLEASRTLPGGSIGDGPVIRVGDASFTFDAEAEAVLLRARETLMKLNPDFKAQRQLMSGGTCEASGFRYHGYRTTGIALPLGNYHNGAPDGAVAAEYIHINDFLGSVDFIVQAARSVAQRRESGPWRRMADIPQEQRERLAGTALGPLGS